MSPININVARIDFSSYEEMYNDFIKQSKVFNITHWRRYKIEEVTFDVWKSEINILKFKHDSAFIEFKFKLGFASYGEMYDHLIKKSKIFNITHWRRYKIEEITFDMWRNEIDLIGFEYHSAFEPVLEFYEDT